MDRTFDSAAGSAEYLDPARALVALAAAVERGERFLVTMHEYPDGDAMGSALGLAQLLRERGKQVEVYCPQGAPSFLAFLPGADAVLRALDGAARWDVTIACDAGDDSRLGPELPGADRRGLLVNLDHHPRSRPFGDINFVDPGAAAVGVLVFRLLAALNHPLSLEVATCLWVSLVSDTGSFRFSNTNAECMTVARELVVRGVRPGEVTSRMYESQPLGRLRLLAEVLKTLELSGSGRTAWITIERDLHARTGVPEEVGDGFISYPRSIAGVEVALQLREEEDGLVRISMRSRGKVDVGALAAAMGGGGHHNASGCAAQGTVASVREALVARIEAALDAAERAMGESRDSIVDGR